MHGRESYASTTENAGDNIDSMKVISCTDAPLDSALFEKIASDRVIKGTPAAAHHIFYSSASNDFNTGIYECTPGKWRIEYSEDEFCALLSGTIQLVSDDGDTQEFTAPASFVIPSGYRGTWEAITPVRKFFVIYEKTD